MTSSRTSKPNSGGLSSFWIMKIGVRICIWNISNLNISLSWVITRVKSRCPIIPPPHCNKRIKIKLNIFAELLFQALMMPSAFKWPTCQVNDDRAIAFACRPLNSNLRPLSFLPTRLKSTLETLLVLKSSRAVFIESRLFWCEMIIPPQILTLFQGKLFPNIFFYFSLQKLYELIFNREKYM